MKQRWLVRAAVGVVVATVAVATARFVALPHGAKATGSAPRSVTATKVVLPKIPVISLLPSAPQRGGGGDDPEDDAVSREFTLFSSLSDQPQDDAVSREFTLFSALSDQPRDDSVSREFTVFSSLSDQPRDDSVSREFTVFSSTSDQPRDDSVSREFTVFSSLSDQPRDDAVSREFTVFTDPQNVAINDSVSREFTIFSDSQNVVINDAVSREFTLFNPWPNLVLDAAAAPVEAVTATAFRFDWTVKNIGLGPATGTWTDRIFLSEDAQLGNDVVLAEFPYSSGLAPNASVNRAQDITIRPQDITEPGLKYLIVYTDANSVVYEEPTNPADNWVAVPIQVSRQSLPDLVVQEIEAPADIFFGQRLTARIRVKNVGDGPTNASEWRERLALVQGQTTVAQAQVLNPEFLEAGEEYWTTTSFNVPKGFFGQMVLRATADSDQVVNESVETNNTADRAIQVKVPELPDLAVGDVRAPEFATAGEVLSSPIEWTVTNIGPVRTPQNELPWTDGVYFSRDTNLSLDDFRIGEFVRTSVLQAGSSYQLSTAGLRLSRSLPPGDYYVIVHCDQFGDIYELSTRGNNISVRSRIITVGGPTADLEPTIVSASRSATSGGEVSVTFRVTNNGPDTASPMWTDQLYLSTNDSLGSEDIVLSSVIRTSQLLRDGSYTVTVNGQIPDCEQDIRYLFVKTDSGDALYEGPYEDNNVTAARPIRIGFDAPDLAVRTVIAPRELDAGQSFRVVWTVENAGDGPTKQGSWQDRVYLSRDQLLSADDRVLGSFTRYAALEKKARYRRDEQVALPGDVDGIYYVLVQADAANVVPECRREGNNVKSSATLQVALSAADLAVSNLVAPDSVQVGQSFDVHWSVLNQGDSPTPVGVWQDTVYFSSDAIVTGDDVVLKRSVRMGGLGAGESYSTSSNVVAPNSIPGNYFILVQTDSSNAVFEGNAEDNSSAFVQLLLNQADVDLAVASVTAPAQADSGVPMTISWAVVNLGADGTWQGQWVDRLILSRDRLVDATDRVLINRSRVGTLASGATYTQSVDLTVPSGLTGDWFIIPVTDWLNQVPETDEFNNDESAALVTLSLPPPVDLVVTSISAPAQGTVGEPITVEYTVGNQGSNSAQGMWTDTIYLSADDVWDINDLVIGRIEKGGPLASGDIYTETLTAPLPPAEPGAYRVLVRTNSRRTVREIAFDNNLRATASTMSVEFATLLVGETKPVNFIQGVDKFFRTPTVPDRTIQFTGQINSQESIIALFLSDGRPPSKSRFDARSSEQASNRANAWIPRTQGASVFSLFEAGLGAGSAGTVSAVDIPFQISTVRPTVIGDNGLVSVILTGGRLYDLEEVSLTQSNVVLRAYDLEQLDGRRVRARFKFNQVPRGSYSLRGRSAAQGETFLAQAVTIDSASPIELNVTYDTNPTPRPNLVDVTVVTVRNEANVDVPYGVFGVFVSGTPNVVMRVDESIPLGPVTSEYGVARIEGSTTIGSNGKETTNAVGFFRDLGPGESFSYQVEAAGYQPNSRIRFEPVAVPTTVNDIVRFFEVRTKSLQQEIVRRGLLNSEPWRGHADSEEELWSWTWSSLVSAGYFKETDLAQGRAEKSFSQRLQDWLFPIPDPCDCSDPKEYVLKCGTANTAPGYTKCVMRENTKCVLKALGSGDCECNTPEDAQKCKETLRPIDPNDKVGPTGFGPEGYVSSGEQSFYVRFENQATAGAHASKIVIEDFLGEGFDPRTVSFGSIRVGDNFLVPVGSTGRFEVTVGGEILFCDISMRIDLAARRVSWTLQAIDPATGEPPVSSERGLLPPEDGAGAGQGYVSYSIRANRTAQTGDSLENFASIVFDQEEPITTNTWRNTLDSGLPTSEVSPIAGASGASFHVSWSGTDMGGSGIADYDIYVSRNGGPFQIWLNDTSATSSVFDGVPGMTYGFYARARDNVGNVEGPKTSPEGHIDTSVFGPVANPAPAITSFQPGQVSAGGSSFNMVIQGRNFQGNARVLWNGQERPVTWISSTRLEVDISSTLIQTPGSVPIVVVNPAGNGSPERSSRPRSFTVVP